MLPTGGAHMASGEGDGVREGEARARVRDGDGVRVRLGVRVREAEAEVATCGSQEQYRPDAQPLSPMITDRTPVALKAPP